MMPPVVISIGGSFLNNWTSMTLNRKKDDLTGTLELTVFAGEMPSAPVARSAAAGAEIQVYIAGQLAFNGNVDARAGQGKKGNKVNQTGKQKPSASKSAKTTSQGSNTVNIGPDEYTLKISARGKTRDLIDSSHQHPTTNMMKPTTRKVVQKLIEPWNIQLDWKAEDIELDKARFRDGARVIDELHRVCVENCYFMYESRDGKLVVCDGCAGGGGDPLILGENILTFSAEQSDEEAKEEIKVKGQRSKKEIWGKKSLEKTVKKQKNSSTKRKTKLTVQHYGDADEKTLERRARFEMNKRNSMSKKITIEVFHVQTPSGNPWDIGDLHYVEVPPEGIFDQFEVTELTYHVNAQKELKTELHLSPPPSGGSGGSGGGFGLSSINFSMGSARRSQAGISIQDGMYPASWGPPILSDIPFMSLVEEENLAKSQPPKTEERKPQVPLVLPPWFGENS